MKFFGIILFALFIFSSCERDDDNEHESLISKNGYDESHNIGENCMQCHQSGGSGEGLFTLAGSVYHEVSGDGYANGIIKLTDEADGQGNSIKEIEIDAKGNFYTTEQIDFGNGLYVTVYGTEGEELSMTSKITGGSCNNCHGNTTGRIEL